MSAKRGASAPSRRDAVHLIACSGIGISGWISQFTRDALAVLEHTTPTSTTRSTAASKPVVSKSITASGSAPTALRREALHSPSTRP